jgi:hypothetical protein
VAGLQSLGQQKLELEGLQQLSLGWQLLGVQQLLVLLLLGRQGQQLELLVQPLGREGHRLPLEVHMHPLEVHMDLLEGHTCQQGQLWLGQLPWHST